MRVAGEGAHAVVVKSFEADDVLATFAHKLPSAQKIAAREPMLSYFLPTVGR